MHDNREPTVLMHEFTRKELQAIVGFGGTCAVCGLAAYLLNAWVVAGLLPVAVMVWLVGREDKR